jgi:hypothetical protein
MKWSIFAMARNVRKFRRKIKPGSGNKLYEDQKGNN